jgi:hypothetical protein
MSTITRGFNPLTNRYEFDFKRCTYANGWAQIDTGQDASYFGQWINPDKLVILSYCEGDITTTQYEDAAALVAAMTGMRLWNNHQGHRFGGIDPGFNAGLKEKFVQLGLSGFLH